MSADEGCPPSRLRALNDAPVRPERAFVLYWMIGARRLSHNHALDRAAHWARRLRRGLLVFEPLRCDYPYASERIHRFVLDGMRDNAERARRARLTYVPWVERAPGEGRGLLAALAREAAVVVTDLSGIPWLRAMAEAAARAIDVRLEAVDSLGLVPVYAAPRAFPTAAGFRRWLHAVLPEHLAAAPRAGPFTDLPAPPPLPRALHGPWRSLSDAELRTPQALVATLPLDREVIPVESERGGTRAALDRLGHFLEHGLPRYTERHHPDLDVASRLSAALHFGHIGVHEVLQTLAQRLDWTPRAIRPEAAGDRERFWNLTTPAALFLDELVTWRHLAQVRAVLDPSGVARWVGLPPWARATLERHAHDPRPALYDLDRLERAATEDPVWNAAQRQLRAQGRIHSYMRMLWGKRVLAWTPQPREAFRLLLHLNDRWSLDGRDPASWLNVGWIFGLCDRPWAPERPIYGTVRYMSTTAALRKLRMRRWLERWSSDPVHA
ncbi:MAG: deoxyribodipyrimidine photolyase [Myxococcota bacterium]|nr:deoxyribodipyrimidine photolyase [Myxococcota bacterium]MDW8363345.1 deoxyribodipyrimidine photolyase [Myxococcales bacterium]